MSDIYSIHKLLDLLNIKRQTLNIYLCRSDFNHVKTFFRGRTQYFYNIHPNDIEKLKDLASRRKQGLNGQMQIIRHYGYENQLKKLIEELRELEEVIIYHPEDEKHLKEEIADVLNLIEQIEMFKHWKTDIENEKKFKIDRQLTRIQDEKSIDKRYRQV